MRTGVFLILMMFGRVFAQTSYFIKPMINNKIDFASSSVRRFDDKVFNSSQYYDYDNKSILFSGLNSIDFGIGIGAEFNKRHIIELIFNTDATGSGHRIYYNYKNLDGGLYPTDRSNIYGKGINRLSMQYSYLGISKFHYIVGASFGFKPPSALGKLDPSYNSEIEVAENVYLSQETWGLGFNKTNIYLTAGIGRDFFYKEKYLISFDVILNKGFSLISGTATDIRITENGATKINHFVSYSKGSGLYFQISRRFILYPRKNKSS